MTPKICELCKKDTLGKHYTEKPTFGRHYSYYVGTIVAVEGPADARKYTCAVKPKESAFICEKCVRPKRRTMYLDIFGLSALFIVIVGVIWLIVNRVFYGAWSFDVLTIGGTIFVGALFAFGLFARIFEPLSATGSKLAIRARGLEKLHSLTPRPGSPFLGAGFKNQAVVFTPTEYKNLQEVKGYDWLTK